MKPQARPPATILGYDTKLSPTMLVPYVVADFNGFHESLVLQVVES